MKSTGAFSKVKLLLGGFPEAPLCVALHEQVEERGERYVREHGRRAEQPRRRERHPLAAHPLPHVPYELRHLRRRRHEDRQAGGAAAQRRRGRGATVWARRASAPSSSTTIPSASTTRSSARASAARTSGNRYPTTRPSRRSPRSSRLSSTSTAPRRSFPPRARTAPTTCGRAAASPTCWATPATSSIRAPSAGVGTTR